MGRRDLHLPSRPPCRPASASAWWLDALALGLDFGCDCALFLAWPFGLRLLIGSSSSSLVLAFSSAFRACLAFALDKGGPFPVPLALAAGLAGASFLGLRQSDTECFVDPHL